MQDDFRPSRPPKPAPELKSTLPSDTKSEQTVPFQTPDQVSEHDTPDVAQSPLDTPEVTAQPRGTGHHWFNIPWPPSRHEIIAITIVLLLAVLGVVSYLVLKPDKAPVKATMTVQQKAEPKPVTVPSTLTGLPVVPEINQRPVVGVMIENSQAARPQSGLSQAGVVFEAIAEGGITRFLSLYQDQLPENIGPIRSARPYYVQWSEGFRAAYVHVGGSPDALANIKAWGVQDFDQFYNSSVFRREGTRSAPHNVYSSVVNLANAAAQKGYQSVYTGFERKAASPAKQPNATSVDINISSRIYNVHYDYNASTNTYSRSEGGEPHVDNNTNSQLAPSVVIGLVVPLGQGSRTSQGGSYSNYNPIGSGVAHIFQDGVVTTGTWTKSSPTAQITFTDAAGAAVKLNPGQTWISAVDASSKVVYK